MTKKSLVNGDLRRQMDAELMEGIKKIASIEAKIDAFLDNCVLCKKEIDSLGKDVSSLKKFESKVYGWSWSGAAAIAFLISWLKGKQ